MNSWGILGNPSKEKIEEYKNMPVGAFRQMVKDLNRRKKGKVLKEHEVSVTKTRSDMTAGTIKVQAFTRDEAIDLARLRLEEIEWEEKPYKTDQVSYIYRCYTI